MPTEVVGVEVAGGLVGDEDHRPVDEGARDRDPLLLAAGELVGHPVALAVEADHLEGLGDQGGDVAAGAADDLEGEGDVLADRLVGEQPEVLEDGADVAAQPRDLPAGEPVDLLAGDVDASRRRAVLAQHEAQERRLARAGGADEEDELALLDVDRDLVERRVGVAGVGLGDLVEANHGCEVTRRRPTPRFAAPRAGAGRAGPTSRLAG